MDTDTHTDEKWCSACQQWKPKTEFNKNKARKDGLQNYCRKCAYKAHRDSVTRNRDKVNAAARRKTRAARIERTYGMTIEEYDLLVFEQNDQCAICFAPLGEHPVPFRSGDSTACDALTCEACGAGLRFFEQSTDRLFRAISFLDSFNLRSTSAVKDESQESFLAQGNQEETYSHDPPHQPREQVRAPWSSSSLLEHPGNSV